MSFSSGTPQAMDDNPAVVGDLSSEATSSSVIDAWIAFNLNARRAHLDEEGLQIAKRQDQSGESRKTLAASTRNFKRNKVNALANNASSQTADIAAASKAFTSLLKDYQGEIDSLTTRAKAAESAFLGLYKALYEVPDPVDDLKRGVADHSALLQIKEEMHALQDEKSGLAERSAAVEKYEARIETLTSENNSLLSRVADEVKSQVEARQAQWVSTHQKALEAYELREQELLHQLSAANTSLRDQQSSMDALKQQRDDIVVQLEEMKKARSADGEMMEEDSKRARDEATELRHRCIQLENQMTSLLGNDGDGQDLINGGSAARASALAAELAAKEVEASQLKDHVAALQEVLTGQNESKSADFAKLSASIKTKDEEIAGLKNTLSALPTLEEFEKMKRQYETLQAFQLNEDTTETSDSLSVSSLSGGRDVTDIADSDLTRAGATALDLEKRLLGKLKVTENKITAMRREMTEKDSLIKELRETLQSLEERSDDQKSLINKLEDGINAITTDPSNSSVVRTRLHVADRGSKEIDATESVPGPGLESLESNLKKSDMSTGAWDWGEQKQAAGLQRIIQKEPSMLDIIAGQRDRFRTRVQELEEENRKTMERLERVTTDLDGLKNDNVRLYEKICFLQSYAQSSSSGGGTSVVDSASRFQTGSNPTAVAIGLEEDDNGNGVLGKYRSIYEELVNPYTLFNRRERYKRLNEMSAPERLTLRASQRALSTKASRLFVFFYVMALHMLVFVVLGFSAGRCPEIDMATRGLH